jgi:Domain of unknown function (DUF4157)
MKSTHQTNTILSSASIQTGLLQRKCTSCGQHTIAGGECADCGKKKIGLQRKLTIGASNDPLELEADRVADRVMAASPNSVVSSAPISIQRFTGQTAGQAEMVAPASVESVLSSPGSPLEPGLQQDMSQRFGHDFSRVRIHTGDDAARSARDVNANAYTVGNNIVFGAGRFAPGTNTGKRLIAHELTHVVQQSSSNQINDAGYGLSYLRGQSKSPIEQSKIIKIHGTSKVRVDRDLSDEPTQEPLSLNFLTPQDIQKLRAFGDADFQQSISTLQAHFDKTKGLTRSGSTQQYIDIRAAAGELRTILDYIRNSDVTAVKVLPSSKGGRSPDMYIRRNGTELRVETTSITLASRGVRPDLAIDSEGSPRHTIPKENGVVSLSTNEFDEQMIKDAIRRKIKSGSQLDTQNSNTQVSGRSMAIGGDIVIQLHGSVEIQKTRIDQIISSLQIELSTSSVQQIVVSARNIDNQRESRTIFEYTRQIANNSFSSAERRPHYSSSVSLTPATIPSSSTLVNTAPKSSDQADQGSPVSPIKKSRTPETSAPAHTNNTPQQSNSPLPKAQDKGLVSETQKMASSNPIFSRNSRSTTIKNKISSSQKSLAMRPIESNFRSTISNRSAAFSQGFAQGFTNEYCALPSGDDINSLFNKDFDSLQPEVQTIISKSEQHIGNLQLDSPGKPIFANIIFKTIVTRYESRCDRDTIDKYVNTTISNHAITHNAIDIKTEVLHGSWSNNYCVDILRTISYPIDPLTIEELQVNASKHVWSPLKIKQYILLQGPDAKRLEEIKKIRELQTPSEDQDNRLTEDERRITYDQSILSAEIANMEKEAALAAQVKQREAENQARVQEEKRKQAKLAQMRDSQKVPPPISTFLQPHWIVLPQNEFPQNDPFNLRGAIIPKSWLDQGTDAADIAEALKSEYIQKAGELRRNSASTDRLLKHQFSVERWINDVRRYVMELKAKGGISDSSPPIIRLNTLLDWVDKPEGRMALSRGAWR